MTHTHALMFTARRSDKDSDPPTLISGAANGGGRGEGHQNFITHFLQTMKPVQLPGKWGSSTVVETQQLTNINEE